MKLLRLLFLILVFIALLGGFVWLGMQDGEVIVKTESINISASPLVAAISLFILTITLTLLWKFIAFLIALPSQIKKANLENNRKKAVENLGLGFASYDVGDYTDARRYGAKAASQMPDNSGLKLFAARTSFAADDIATAEKLFGELLSVSGFEIAARKGLADISKIKGNFASVISHADAALQISKRSVWPVETLFKERIGNFDWEGALGAIDEGDKRGLMGKKTVQRRRASVLTAAAHRYERNGDLEKSLDYSSRAVKICPDFAPAAIMAARLNHMANKDWAAASAIENAWQSNPHPALSLAYRDLKPNQDKEARIKWLEGLIKINPEARESKILRAELFIENSDGLGAAQILDALIAIKPTSRIYAMRAQAALLSGNKKLHDDFIKLAASAPREADWSDLDPNGNAFVYEDADWALIIENYGDNGVLVHPRQEKAPAKHIIFVDQVKVDSQTGQVNFNPTNPDILAGESLDALEHLGDDIDSKKKNWLSF